MECRRVPFRASPLLGRVAGFLEQLALGANQRIFARVQLTCGKLGHDPIHRVTKLALQQHMIVVQQGDDNDRAGMHDVFSAGALPIWQSDDVAPCLKEASVRSEEHTSELQSLMRTSYAVFCLKKKHSEQI